MADVSISPFNNTNQQKRIFWLDFLKVVAILGMIVLHVSAVGLSEEPVGTKEWHISNFLNSMSRFCVPIFIMISGALFLNKTGSMRKYIIRIVVALILWSIAYTLFAHSLDIAAGEYSFPQFFRDICSPTHLWFLYMITGIYLITPILRKIVSDQDIMKYFLFLWLIFGIGLRALCQIPLLEPYLEKIINQMHFMLALEYSGYYVLGFFLLSSNTKRIEKYSWILFSLGVLSTFIGTYYVSSIKGSTDELFYNYLYPTTLLSSSGIFLLFKRYVSQISLSEGFKRTISLIASLSLGIYIIHMFFLATFHKIGFDYLFIDTLVSIPIITIIAYTLSLSISYIIHRYLPYGKQLV